MASIAATNVAKEVLGSIGKGIRPNITKLAVKNGYSYKTANSGIVQKTKSYKDTIAPAIIKMEKLRDKALNALANKDLNLEDARVLKELVESFTKNIMLLGGKATENVAVQVSIVNYGDTPS